MRISLFRGCLIAIATAMVVMATENHTTAFTQIDAIRCSSDSSTKEK